MVAWLMVWVVFGGWLVGPGVMSRVRVWGEEIGLWAHVGHTYRVWRSHGRYAVVRARLAVRSRVRLHRRVLRVNNAYKWGIIRAMWDLSIVFMPAFRVLWVWQFRSSLVGRLLARVGDWDYRMRVWSGVSA